MKSKYKIDSMPFSKLAEKVNVPKFQRGIVWNFNKRKNFINTVLSGNPFGALLLYQDNLTTVSLIDGLQRYSTLKSFAKNPLEYVNILDYCKNSLNELMNLIFSEIQINGNGTEIKNALQYEIKRWFSLNDEPTMVLEHIMESLPFLNGVSTNTYRKFSIMLSELKSDLDISTLDIPYIMFEGDVADLPGIFEEMNNTGTTLTKYDLYSAKWGDYMLNLRDNDLLSIIDSKYTSMIEESETEISNYTSGEVFTTNEINLYEYCYAVGKLLKDKCPKILTTRSVKGKTVESLGFLIISAILCGSTKHIDYIPSYFQNASAGDLQKFKDKIIECALSVEHILNEYITIPHGALLQRYIESQMICIIVTLFNIRYVKESKSLKFLANGHSSKYTALFKRYMPKRYLYDIVSEYWSGNGDRRLADELSKNLTDNRYLCPISETSWRSALQSLVDDQTNKPMKNVPTVNKLILNYILRHRINRSFIDKPLEIDLVVTRDSFKGQMRDCNGICALGNVLIFPRFENRSKSGQTWYAYNRDKTTLTKSDGEMLNLLMYPSPDELSFTESVQTFTHENFKRFLNERHNFLINQFIDYYL